MATKPKRVVKSFSELAVTPIVERSVPTAVAPSEEEAPGGFVVGAILEEAPQAIEPEPTVAAVTPEDEADAVVTADRLAELTGRYNDGLLSELEYLQEYAWISPTEENLNKFVAFRDATPADVGLVIEAPLVTVEIAEAPEEELTDEVILVDDEGPEDTPEIRQEIIDDLISDMTDEEAPEDDDDRLMSEEQADDVRERQWSDAAQHEAEQIARAAMEENLPADVTIVHGDNTVSITDGEVETISSDGELADNSDERAALLAEIDEYLPPGRLVNRDVFKNMTVTDLGHHLQLLQMNNGGSPSAAKILQEVEAEYVALINSPDMKRRLALLEAKGADFHLMAQKLSKVMGNEVTLKGMRYQEYHQLLEHLTRGTTIIYREIAAAADYMGIKMPIDELVPSMGAVPIVEGMAIDEKTAMYVLRVLMRQVEHWHHASLLLQQNYDNDDKEKKTLQERLKTVSDRLKEEQAEREQMVTSLKERFIEMPEFYIYVAGGGFLSLKDEDEELSLKNLTLSHDIREALFLNNKKAAERIIEVISDKSKFADYDFKIRRLAAVEV